MLTDCSSGYVQKHSLLYKISTLFLVKYFVSFGLTVLPKSVLFSYHNAAIYQQMRTEHLSGVYTVTC